METADKMEAQFNEQLNEAQRNTFYSLNSPIEIQAFLDRTPYSAEERNRSPLNVLRDGVAHCLDGALFAAAALRRIGYPPLILDLLPEPGTDDDHVLAVFTQDGHFGAVAKSNFSGLRFREPVYRNPRELVLSYFEDFFNVHGQKTLRDYTRTINLKNFDRFGWLWNDEAADIIEQRLAGLSRIPLITPRMAQNLSPVDELAYKAGMLGVNEAGLYKPQK